MLTCILCDGDLKEEADSTIAPYTCKCCDCLQNEHGEIFSDVPFFIANYGTNENIEIFQDRDEAKKASVDGLVHTAILNHSNVWFEDGFGWNYDDDSELFLSEPLSTP
jgi:hypothetical protein